MSNVRPSVEAFVDQLANLRFDCVFNPYSQVCPDHDEAAAPTIRRRNLTVVLEAALTCGVDSLWIARDLGYRGGRRTGLALTDEVHLAAHAQLLHAPALARSTKGPAVAERTAAFIWQALGAIQRPIFLWNVFPLHPHEAGKPLSNRCHTRRERVACQALFFALLDMLAPAKIVAIGRDSAKALEKLDLRFYSVRHPSYGGQGDFIRGISELYWGRESAPADKEALSSPFGGVQAAFTPPVPERTEPGARRSHYASPYRAGRSVRASTAP